MKRRAAAIALLWALLAGLPPHARAHFVPHEGDAVLRLYAGISAAVRAANVAVPPGSAEPDRDEAYGYTDATGRYGNAPEAAPFPARRLVSGDGMCFLAAMREDMESYHGALLERLDADGPVPLTDIPVGQIAYYGGYLYFSDLHPGNIMNFYSLALYRIRADGTGLRCVYFAERPFDSFQIANGRIYLLSGYAPVVGVQSLSLDGGDLQILASGEYSHLTVYGDRAYFFGAHDWGSGPQYTLFRCALDGTQLEALQPVPGYECLSFADGGWLHYYDEDAEIQYRVPLGGGEPQIVADGLHAWHGDQFVHDGMLYFIYSDKREEKGVDYFLARMPVTGGPPEVLCRGVMRNKYSELTTTALDGMLYFYTPDYTYCRIPLSGGAAEQIAF